MSELSLYRRFFAEEIQSVAELQSEALVQALATVPREAFLSPGPWQIASFKNVMGPREYRRTPNDNPKHLYHNVAVGIDPARFLNNGQPSALAPAMDALELRSGESVLHVGVGTGYYSAILSEVVGPTGHVVAIELDPGLAERARANLASRPWVEVYCGDGSELHGPFDAILINAGATHPRSEWLDALAPNGRLVLPLTASVPGLPFAAGFFTKIGRSSKGYFVQILIPVAIFDCAGARDEALNTKLGQLARQGGWRRIHSLRRDTHAEAPSCVLHASHFCLSEETLDQP